MCVFLSFYIPMSERTQQTDEQCSFLMNRCLKEPNKFLWCVLLSLTHTHLKEHNTFMWCVLLSRTHTHIWKNTIHACHVFSHTHIWKSWGVFSHVHLSWWTQYIHVMCSSCTYTCLNTLQIWAQSKMWEREKEKSLKDDMVISLLDSTEIRRKVLCMYFQFHSYWEGLWRQAFSLQFPFNRENSSLQFPFNRGNSSLQLPFNRGNSSLQFPFNRGNSSLQFSFESPLTEGTFDSSGLSAIGTALSSTFLVPHLGGCVLRSCSVAGKQRRTHQVQVGVVAVGVHGLVHPTPLLHALPQWGRKFMALYQRNSKEEKRQIMALYLPTQFKRRKMQIIHTNINYYQENKKKKT